MLKTSVIAILCLLAFSCSSQKDIVKKEPSLKQEIDEEQKKKLALEHFINGSTAESKGDYASAILEFQDAARFDESAGIYYGLAKNYYNLNKLSLALQNSKKALELDSGKTEYYNLLSDIYSSGRQLDSAAFVLEKLINIDSTNVHAFYKLARLYENSKPIKAVSIYQKLSSIIGPDWNVLIRTVELQEKLGNIDEAAESVEELLTVDPSNTSLQKLAVDFYIRNERYDEALKIINDILELTPEDLNARESKAQIFISKGEWQKASNEYTYLLDQTDIPLEVKIRIGAAYFNQSFKDSSLLPVTKEIFQTLDKDTTDWQIKMYLGAVSINEGDDSTAINYFEDVTRLARWNVNGWIRLGGLYFDNRKYEEAATVMNEAITSFPEDFTINLILGLSLSQQGNNSEARSYLKKAVELNPEDINALSAYAFTLNQLLEYDEAVKYLNKALTIKPDDINLLGTLGLIYNNQGNDALSDSVYESALKIDPDNDLVNNNYAYSLSERGIQLERALEMVQISLRADSTNSSYLDTIGWIYYKMGRYDLAKEYVQKAIDNGGENAEVLEHLGDIVYKIGQLDYAKELWEKALQLDVTNMELKQKIER